MVRVSKPLYLGGILVFSGLGMVIMLIGNVMAQTAKNNSDQELAMQITLMGLLPVIIGFIIRMVLLYKMWDAIQESRPRTTPGMAVGLMFIPCWNIYWLFQTHWGWAQDFNRFADEDDLDVPKMPEGLALTYCLLNLAAIVPFLGPIAGFVGFVILLIFLNKACDGVNALADAEPGSGRRYDDDDDDYDDRRRSRSRSRGRRRDDDDDDDDYDDRRSTRSSRRDDDDDDDREEPKWSPRDDADKKKDRFTDKKSERRNPDEDEDDDRS